MSQCKGLRVSSNVIPQNPANAGLFLLLSSNSERFSRPEKFPTSTHVSRNKLVCAPQTGGYSILQWYQPTTKYWKKGVVRTSLISEKPSAYNAGFVELSEQATRIWGETPMASSDAPCRRAGKPEFLLNQKTKTRKLENSKIQTILQ